MNALANAVHNGWLRSVENAEQIKVLFKPGQRPWKTVLTKRAPVQPAGHNTQDRLRQLEKLGPSTDTYRLLKEVCSWLDTSVTVLSLEISEPQPSVLWAFTTGKSARAQELRVKVVAELKRRLVGVEEVVAA